jgi:hypothetical protein
MSGGSASYGQLAPGSVFPLRRLGQSEVFSTAFAIIRLSPRATLGLPFLTALLSFFFTLILALIWPSAAVIQLSGGAAADEEYLTDLLADGWLIVWTLLTGAVSQLLLLTVLSLMVIPAMRATLGLRTNLWNTLRLRSSRLGWLVLHIVLLVLLAGVVGVVSLGVALLVSVLTLFIGLIVVIPALFLLLCWLTAAFMYGPMTILVERENAFSALGRSWRLNRGKWWRNIGTVALLYLMITIVITVASLPLGLFTGLGQALAWDAADPQNGNWVSFAIFAVGQLYSAVLSALSVGLIGVIISVMYFNARVRQEALDVALTAATISPNALHNSAEVPQEEAEALVPGSAEHLGRFYAAAR